MSEKRAEILGMMGSEDAELRRQAVVAVSGSGLEESVGLLLRAVSDPDWRVRKTAVEALVEAGGDEVLEGLYRCLFSEDNAGARNSAAEGLIKLGSPTIAALGKRLDEPDDDVRKFIVDIIGEIGDLSGAPVLIRAMRDKDSNVRASAIEHLGRMKAAEALDPLVETLRTADQWLAFTAAAALGELGDGRAVAPLMEAAQDRYLKEAALDALRMLADQRCWPVFMEALSDPVPVIRELAVKGIAELHRAAADKAALAASLREKLGEGEAAFLKESLDSEDTDLAACAVYVLGVVRDRSAVDKVARLLVSEEIGVYALDALHEIAKDGVEPLLFLLTSEDSTIRASAAAVLGRAGDGRVVNFLIPLLSDENGHVRGAAAAALGRLGDSRAAPPLVELLKDEYQDVQEEAIAALGMLKEAGIAGQLRDLARDSDHNIRRNIASLIGILDGPESSEILFGLMKDEEAEVRMAAVASYGRAGRERGIKGVFTAVTDEDPQVRLAAVNVLSEFGTEESVDPLLLLLRDVDPWVRAAAVRGLAVTGSPRMLEGLVPLLEDAYGPVRIAVVEALGTTGKPEALREVKKSLSNADPEIRKAAVGVLANFSDAGLDDAAPLLKDDNWSVRKAAVELIGMMKYPGYREALEDVLASDEDDIVRDSAKAFL